MKAKYKMPAVLAISFILVFAQAAGYYFSKSLFLLSLSLFSFSFAFHILVKFANTLVFDLSPKDAQELTLGQLKPLLINSTVIIIVAALIILRALPAINNPMPVNFELGGKFLAASSLLLAIISVMLISVVKSNPETKPLLLRSLFVCFIAALGTLNIMFFHINLYETDTFTALAAAVIIIFEAGFLLIGKLKEK
ncbi:MAG: hypothetical protein LBB93_05320 [Elusimicrobiota bacterium]|jgi:Co/Zn/Cd efflux system component|nr:hypothetical protein [Elusimicrobiota bacterium]